MALGLSLRQAAEVVKLTHSRIAEIERGRSYRTDNPSRPGREVVVRIAIAYGLAPDLLMAHAGYSPSESLVPDPRAREGELTAEEREVLLLFEALDPDRRSLALSILRAIGGHDANADGRGR